MAGKLPFEEGASIKKPHLFCGLNYKYWEVRMKIFVESIDQGIWDAIENDLSFLRLKRVDLLLRNLGPNGLMKKVKRPSLIALPRIS